MCCNVLLFNDLWRCFLAGISQKRPKMHTFWAEGMHGSMHSERTPWCIPAVHTGLPHPSLIATYLRY